MRPILSMLQFTTILPLGKEHDFEPFARHSYLYPIAGYIIGAIVALPLFFIGNPTIAAAVAIIDLFLITGVHHFDGLLDFGDGMMAHGNKEKRIQALTDRQIGAGGVSIGIVVTLLLFSGLQASSSIISAVVIGEVCAKFSMAFLTTTGTPFKEGIHSYLNQFTRPYFPIISALLCVPLILLPVSPLKLVAAGVVMILCPVILLVISNRLFGGVNGDIVGASNEITRACVIVSLAFM